MGRRRLRSGTVLLGGVGLLAASLAACGSEPDKRCADPVSREILPDSRCKSGSSGSGGGGGKYYYGGTVSDGKVSGGSFDKSAVKRGGFGKSGSGGG
ncbi:hypothetical protein [Streptomyces genisteinicus]|uniref:Lipoprotein n=1 Tax=Streptomyces genisteinicus TaxID=2768068 RepID=A0A7H0HWF1_9ACTN|nr:hypothetical protein [Streptomyces genisteinicus]QNP64867.1 hypothetical protein IAG43_19400 [Streptomyces genisteinicus]